MHTKSSARSILSATAGLSLAAFTAISAFTGVSPSVTASAFGLLTIYGIVEMMIHTYAPRRLAVRRVARRLASSTSARVRVPALIEYPAATSRACAA